MASDAPTAHAHVSDLDWLMSGLVQRVPHTNSAVLLSCDGLVKSVHGLDPDSADHMAALACPASTRSAAARACASATAVTYARSSSNSTRPCCSSPPRAPAPVSPCSPPRGRRGGARLRDGDAGQERPSVSDDRARQAAVEPPAMRP